MERKQSANSKTYPQGVKKGGGRFEPGHQKSLKFGGEGALVRIRKGQEFIGVALEALECVVAEMGVDLDALSGIEAILVKRAARFEATARLFDSAALSAAETGDLDTWERYQQRSGWIGSKAFLAMQDVIKVLGNRPHMVDYEELLSETD